MELELKGIVNRVDRDRVYVSVVNAYGIEVDLTLPKRMFSEWKSVNNGDLLKYRIWDVDLVLQHKVIFVEPPPLDEAILREIDDRCSRLFLN